MSQPSTGKTEWIIAGVILAIGIPATLIFTKGSGSSKSKTVPYSAITACQERIRSLASHPSTVEFSMLGQSSDFGAPGGGYRVGLSFQAKNSFGLSIKHNALCKFAPGSLQITEAGAWEAKS